MADDVEMTPISAEELPPKVTPFGAPAAQPAPAEPASAPAADATASTIRLKPVIRKPLIRKPLAPGAASAGALSRPSKTQAIKSITGPIPAQATLRKTGIVAEGILTPAQQQAAKSKTSRISLESAIGVAPTTAKGPAPLKTIRLRRPTDLHKPAAPSPLAASKPEPVAETPAALSEPVAELKPVEAAASDADATVTQKKTLKLHRSAPAVKPPAMIIGDSGLGNADASAVGDDVPEMKPLDMPMPEASVEAAGAPGWLVSITLVASIAALLVLGAVFYFLFTEGCAPVSGVNYTAFMSL